MWEELLVEMLRLLGGTLGYMGIVYVIKKLMPKKQLNYTSKIVLKETIIQRWFANFLFLLGMWLLVHLIAYTSNPELLDDISKDAPIRRLSMIISLVSTHIFHNFMINLIKRASAKVIVDN